MWYEIFKFELQYRKGRFDAYFFFIALFLFSMIAFNFLTEGTPIGLVKENAPYLIARIMLAVTGLFMTVSSIIMGVPILRDFEYKIESLVFVNPIKKWEYLLGRFAGSFVVLILIFTAMPLGIMAGELMPWRAAENMGPFRVWHYLKPFLTLVLPSLFMSGSIFFISGAFTKNLIVVYTQGLFLFVLFVLSYSLGNETIAALIDPFSYKAVGEVVKDWGAAEKSYNALPVTGVLLGNKILWTVIAVVVLVLGYHRFSFSVLKKSLSSKGRMKGKNVSFPNDLEATLSKFQLQDGLKTKLQQLKSHSLFYFRSILSEVSFWSIAISAMIIVFINSFSLGTTYGVDSYPATYLIVEELQETTTLFFLIILVFYSGELIWKERKTKIDLIVDSMPVSNFMLLAGKFIGLNLIYLVLLTALIISGLLFQIVQGYYLFDLKVYVVGFYVEVFTFLSLFTFISFFIHVIVNSKYIGFVLTFLSFALTLFMDIFGIGNILTRFGSATLGKYSAMNGYGQSLQSFFISNTYWFAFSILLFVVTSTFLIRGKYSGWRKRISLSKLNWSNELKAISMFFLVIFLMSGSYIFYDTNILQNNFSASEQAQYRANYEKKLKHLEYIPQPKIVDVKLEIELFPSERYYCTEGLFTLVNEGNESIQQIHIQKLISDQDHLVEIKFDRNTTIDNQYEDFFYFIYELDEALNPGDSIRMEFHQNRIKKGLFGHEDESDIVENGIFLNSDKFPTLGYNNHYELEEGGDRKDHGLMPQLGKADTDDYIELTYGRSGGDGSKVNFEITIGTDADQIAIAPGNLLDEWQAEERNYFHYKMEQPMVNFYSIVSAKYDKLSKSLNLASDLKPVDLEIFYHKGHEYNTDRMMHGMESALKYCSENYGKYPYDQLRIMEFPRYQSFAQSYPSAIPFSEDLGFILKVDDEKDVDMPFFIAAHETAHQWWGLQVVAANVKGRHLILESLSQYSALMVMKKHFPQKKIDKFLDLELKNYFDERQQAIKVEVPIASVDDEDYIYYRKGALILYALQEHISEDSVNLALRRFVESWNVMDQNFDKDRFATSQDLLCFIREVTPDSLQNVITDLFEKVTFYDNLVMEASTTQIKENSYLIEFQISIDKMLMDNKGVEKEVLLNTWIELGVYSENESGKDSLLAFTNHFFQKDIEKLEVSTTHKPHKVIFDPNRKLLNKEYQNCTLIVSDQYQTLWNATFEN